MKGRPFSPACFLAALLALSPALLRADDEAGPNLLPNPSFEAPDYAPWGWDDSYYGKPEGRAKLVTDNPHSGKQSVWNGEGHFTHKKIPVRKGTAVELRFWARGVVNTAPVTIIMRQWEPTDRVIFRTEQAFGEQWQEYVFRALIPADTPANASIYLGFWLHAPGGYWLDDISLRELPAAEGGEPPSVNPIRNPSFEAGTDGWTAMIRKPEFNDTWEWQQESGNAYPSQDSRLLSMTGEKLPHGRRHLSFVVQPGGQALVTSAYFQARYGRKSNLVFWCRTDVPHSFFAGIAGGKNQGVFFESERQYTSNKWQKHTVPVLLKPSIGGLYVVKLQITQPGVYQFDDFSLVETGQPEPVLHPPSMSVQAAPEGPEGNMFSRGDKAVFRLVVTDEKPQTQCSYRLTVVDWQDRRVSGGRINVTTDADGTAGMEFAAPTSKYGAFRIKVRKADAPETDVDAEQIYTVLPDLPPPAERPDSFFGNHVDLTPYNLEVARRAGFRWLRLYPPLLTKWMVLEPKPGQWRFKTGDLERAKAAGFQILGSFDTAPDWAADTDSKSPVKNRWNRAYPPADMAAWKNYVTRAFETLSPYISAWELWNEPDGGYMQVRPNLKKDDVMLSLLGATREALDATGKPYLLLAPAVSRIEADLAFKILERGGGAKMDALSFHYYNFTSTSPESGFLKQMLARYRSHKNHAGEPMPLWQSEGGVYISGGHSWLETYRIPPSSSMKPAQGAASMVRAALFFKSEGVKRYIGFAAHAVETGRNTQTDECTGYTEVTGVPSLGVAAHAAMVALTEDAASRGFETREMDGGLVSIARFAQPDGRALDVYWSAAPLPFARAVNLREGDEVLDLMGNLIASDKLATATIGELPLYIRRAAGAAE
ncbi:hypothetical protein OH491_06900 [Termitidicoccus mucosus]|uniref:Glycoside hydrolase family 42 N-terminal domain-containing protein n=1 Tax=Termitidicoccus mucosus TaxID=1184151 RepID=A0A178IEY9_9BACT|nr:hypothetical protein AW736_18195 [Opitutaceae bacterium TSB47]